jgi:hypothetical protein
VRLILTNFRDRFIQPSKWAGTKIDNRVAVCGKLDTAVENVAISAAGDQSLFVEMGAGHAEQNQNAALRSRHCPG